MELVNATRMQAGYAMGLEPNGRELLVVVVKGTFDIPKPGVEVQLSDKQLPLIDADTFTGEPGKSAPTYESDYAPFKPRCDVILNGSAYAPGGVPTRRVTVSLSVGRMQKRFEVLGTRRWIGGFGLDASEPGLFQIAPFSYDTAFGGVDEDEPDLAKRDAFMPNPVGRGFAPSSSPSQLDGKPLPNTQEVGRSLTKPEKSYRAMSFGPIGRAWQPRSEHAGTYDQYWIDNVFPFLPADFENRYYQCAPEDQQIDYVKGGEPVVLENLTEDGRRAFRLPSGEMPVAFQLKSYQEIEQPALCDTVAFEPNAGRFFMVWRTALPLRRNMFEVNQVVAGKMSPAWYRARALGKTYYPSLKQMSDLRRSDRNRG